MASVGKSPWRVRWGQLAVALAVGVFLSLQLRLVGVPHGRLSLAGLGALWGGVVHLLLLGFRPSSSLPWLGALVGPVPLALALDEPLEGPERWVVWGAAALGGALIARLAQDVR